MKRKTMVIAVAAICIGMMAGCNKTAQVEEPVQFVDDEEFLDEFDEYEEYPDEEYEDDEFVDDNEEYDKDQDNDKPVKVTAAGKSEDAGSGEENTAKETEVADGTYLTDETYSGYLSDSADLLVITTALNHEDENWNTVLDYKKQEFRFPVSKDCKCVVFTEDREENPIAERTEFINEFLKGNSGLPIILKIVNGKVVEIGFSS
ncbi:MAG: hypothetical protein J5910_04315 [Lachnospiraceae bacterium]|nr:hypothetical protein [Lachnospiraceae bacterium]